MYAFTFATLAVAALATPTLAAPACDSTLNGVASSAWSTFIIPTTNTISPSNTNEAFCSPGGSIVIRNYGTTTFTISKDTLLAQAKENQAACGTKASNATLVDDSGNAKEAYIITESSNPQCV